MHTNCCQQPLASQKVNGFDASLHLLHGLAARQCTEAIDVGLGVHQIPELFSAATCQRVLDRKRAAQANHVGGGVATLDSFPAGIGRPVFFERGDLLFTAELFGKGLWHEITPGLIETSSLAASLDQPMMNNFSLI